jgi:hypothetical protein
MPRNFSCSAEILAALLAARLRFVLETAEFAHVGRPRAGIVLASQYEATRRWLM